MHAPTRPSMLRTRWAAIGAAVAVTLGGGGLGVTHAVTGSGDRPIYLPINPCRLADLRPAPDQVGPRSAPLGPNEVATFDGWGAVGDCNLPSGTSGLALNVTAVNATADTWLRFWPSGEPEPGTANLNPSPGQPPTPNAVNVSLNDSGEFDVRNRFGNVNVVIDVVGIYDHHHHDDRYYTEAEIDAYRAANAPLFATIFTDGTVWQGISSGLVSSGRTSEGTYTITFNRNVEGCAAVTSDWTFGVTKDISADVIFDADPNTVTVVTRNSMTGVLVDSLFNLVVQCPEVMP